MLTCKQLTEIVTDYLEGRLHFMEWIGFQLHVGQMKMTIRTAAELPPAPIPPEVRDELLKRFRNWKSTSGEREPGPETPER